MCEIRGVLSEKSVEYIENALLTVCERQVTTNTGVAIGRRRQYSKTGRK